MRVGGDIVLPVELALVGPALCGGGGRVDGHARVIRVDESGGLEIAPPLVGDTWPGLYVNTGATLTPTLSLAEGEGVVSIPSPPEGERDRVRGSIGRGARVRE